MKSDDKCCRRCVSMDVLLRRLFFNYAHVVNRFRWFFLIVPFIVACLGSSGLYFLRQQTRNATFYVYTPIGAQSYYEKAVLDEHWPLDAQRFFPGKYYRMKYYAEVLVQSKDDGNLLREEQLNATVELNRYILRELAVGSYDRSFNITYPMVCMTYEGECFENGQLDLLQNAREIRKFAPVEYPISRKNDAPFYLGSSVGGVRLIETNDSSSTQFDYVRTFRLTYYMMEGPTPFNTYSRQWMLALEQYVRSLDSPSLKFGLNHAETLDQGLDENAKRLIPKFTTTFLVLAVFCTLCSFVLLQGGGEDDSDGAKSGMHKRIWRSLCSIDWIRSKPGLALVGIWSSCMAIATSIGFMLMVGMEFNSVVCVMPFLVLSIGVNDMCIMTTAWHRTSLSLPVHERLAEMMSDAAVAITITSLTDVISFAIGSWSSLPAVIMFCSFTSVALLFEYIYQITFFAAAFAFYGHAESRGKHCLVLCAKGVPEDKRGLNWFQTVFCRGTIAPPPHPMPPPPPILPSPPPLATDAPCKHPQTPISTMPTTTTTGSDLPAPNSQHRQPEKETAIMRFFRCQYAPAILHPIGRALVVIIYLTYIAVALWGCTKIKEGLQFSNLVHRQHYMTHYIDMLPDFWREGMQAQIVVSSPPNFTLPTERKKLFEMVERFENTRHSMRSNATMFFLKEYMNYLDWLNAEIEDTYDFWYVKLKRWLKHTGSEASWESDLRWAPDDEYRLIAFRFQIGLHDFSTGDQHREAATELRRLASEYSEFNVSTYHEYWPFVDQYAMIRPNVIQDNIIAVISMIIIASVFIPNLACGVFITLSMLSINLTVYGYMAWWNVNLDCVSMITLVMALGFAVDYSAHICYAYVSAQGMPTSRRTVAALETLGWPVFQGALTTLFGTFVLATVDAYLVQTFFKTVFLTILFGLLHSIVFLPVFLSLLLPENGVSIRKGCRALGAKLGVRSRAIGSSSSSDVVVNNNSDKGSDNISV